MLRRPASSLVALLGLLGSPDAGAQAPLAPPNPQEEMCIEAMADTPEEIAMAEAIGEPPDTVASWEELVVWGRRRAIEVYGSEEAARAAGEKVQRAKYTRRVELLREAAYAGHLPSLYLLARDSHLEEVREIPGAMGAEEKASALRTLHEHGFPLVPEILGGQCLEELQSRPEPPEVEGPRPDCTVRALYVEPGPYRPPGAAPPDFCTDEELVEWEARREAHQAAQQAEAARHRTEIAARREECLDLIREGGFRGHTYAWEMLAGGDEGMPPVERHAWLELDERVWRERGWTGTSNVPGMRQDRLVEELPSEEDRREAVALAERYVEVLWPRRIEGDACRLLPQFDRDPDPYAADLTPR